MIRHIAKQMKVYISYHHSDAMLCDIIKAKLLSKDMLVLSDKEICIREQIEKAVNRNIKEACHGGFVILLITENTANSKCIFNKINQTINERGKLVPVYVGNARLPQEWLPLIGDIQGIHFSEKPTEEELDNLIVNILNRVEHYNSDFRFSCGFLGATKIELPPISIIDDFTFDDCVNLKEVSIPASVISITKKAFRNQPDILVKCPAGSYAEQYCIKYNINYVLVK